MTAAVPGEDISHAQKFGKSGLRRAIEAQKEASCQVGLKENAVETVLTYPLEYPPSLDEP